QRQPRAEAGARPAGGRGARDREARLQAVRHSLVARLVLVLLVAGGALCRTATAQQGITAANVRSLVRQQVAIDGTVDAAITSLPRREKIASPLNYFRGRVIATTGGYIGDASPYQGHVAVLDAASGRLLHVWNSLCSDRPGLLVPASCPASGSAIWGRAGAV